MAHAVTVEPSGVAFEVAAGETILEAGIRQGIAMPYGCKDGTCGSCKCQKLSGTVRHRPYQSKALNDEEALAGQVLACCAVPESDVLLSSRQVTADGAFPVKKLPARVGQMLRVSHDVMVLQLQVPASQTFRYHAGQYIEVLLKEGVRRAYSMANAPQTQDAASPVIELHVRHMPGGRFTDEVFGSLKEKDLLRLEGPFGSFYLRASDKPIVLLASGTGFAPIKALLQQLRAEGSTRPVTLYLGGRRPADLYDVAWLQAQQQAMPQLRYVPVISNAEPEDTWTGRTGFVHCAVLEDFPNLSGHQVYACGAPIVVDSARADYTRLGGLPVDEFHADSFTSAADKTPA